MYYGSPFYCFMLFLPPATVTLFFFLLRNKSKTRQITVIAILASINLLQHILKPFLYPGYYGTGFSYLISAYNMCALLILISPFVLFWGNRFLKNFLYFVGSVAGFCSIAFPQWFIGRPVSALGWEYARFYICHFLLFLTSSLPLFLKLHAPSFKEFWQIGFGFLGALCVILVNNVIFISAGLFPGVSPDQLYDGLVQINPCRMMAPDGIFSKLIPIVKFFTPDIFLGKNNAGQYAPILWYAIPVYMAITIMSFVVFAIWDRKNVPPLRRHKK